MIGIDRRVVKSLCKRAGARRCLPERHTLVLRADRIIQ